MDSVSGVAGSNFSRRYRFADLTIDVGQRRLLRAGEEIALSKLSYELMRVLVEAAPNLVTHEQLAAKVWGPRRIVTPENLAKRVMMLRQALGDHADAPRYIEGVRGQGYRLVPEVEVVDSMPRTEPPSEPRSRRRLSYVLGALAVVALGLVAFERYGASRDTVPRPSIALLPCENRSAGQEDTAFVAAGLRNELLGQLAKAGGIKVVESLSTEPRTSREIGREHGVASILTCTIMRAGDAVHVSVLLVDAETEQQGWMDGWRRELTAENTFDVPREIATSIASVLRVVLMGAEPFRKKPTENQEALDLYSAARSRRVANAEDARLAIERFDKAVRLDPEFAEAWVSKGVMEASYLAFASPEEVPQLRTAALKDVKRAVDLRPRISFVRMNSAIAISALGDLKAAEHEFRIAFALGAPRGVQPYAQDNLAVGYFDDALNNVEAQYKNNRIAPDVMAYLLAAYGLLGETELEEEVFAKGKALHDNEWFGGLHEFYLRLGRTHDVDGSLPKWPEGHDLSVYLDSPAAGVKEVVRIVDTEEVDSAHQIHFALWAAAFGDDELALRLLTRAFEHTRMNTWFIWMPLFKQTRQQPGFETLVRDLGLVDYWEEFGWPDICQRVDGDRIHCE